MSQDPEASPGATDPVEPAGNSEPTGADGPTQPTPPQPAPLGVIPPLVHLDRNHAFVEPGQAERVDLTVRNVSGIVESYSLTAIGPAAPFVEILPDELSLFPGDEGTASVSLRPPRVPTAVAGDYVIGIRALSHVTRDSAATGEIVVTVAPFYSSATDVSQTTFAVRTKATTQVQIINRGNSTVTYSVTASDPDGYMTVSIQNPTVTLAPGDSIWIPITVKMAPKLFGTTNENRSALVEVIPVLNADTDTPIIDTEPLQQRVTVLHKPIIRLRMGGFGRLILIFTILALIAGVIWAKYRASVPPENIGAPVVPAQLVATVNDQNQPILTWNASAGASGYTLYAVGKAGDPVSTATASPLGPVTISPVANASGRSSTRATASATSSTGTPPASPATSPSSPSPSPSPTPTLNRATPLCNNCTEVGTVDGGTTRFVVTDAPSGINCYRIAAKAGTIQSLYSPQTCVFVPGPTMVVDASGSPVLGPDGQPVTTTPPTPPAPAPTPTPPPIAPCPPIDVSAHALTTGGIALVWKKTDVPPKGFVAPAPSAGASPSASASPTKKKGKKTKPAQVCDPAKELTGWTAQRQVFTGWSDVVPNGQPNDTAMEIGGLADGTQFCFRLRANAADANSVYAKIVCATTAGEAPSAAASPSTAPSPSDAPAAASSPSPTP